MKTKRKRTATKTFLDARSYEGTLNSKKRIVIRGARHKHYLVHEEPNGSIVLTPQKLVSDLIISKRTLAMIDASMENFKNGIVSEPIDLEPYRKEFASSEKAAPRRMTRRALRAANARPSERSLRRKLVKKAG